MKKFVLTFAALGLATMSAAEHYNVKFFMPAEVGGRIVKPGEYSLELKGDHAVLKGMNGKFETEARIENGEHKFRQTVVRYANSDSNAHLDEIRIGGTATTVVFAKSQVAGH